mmetsp:Transcript_82104/g.145038  ORF Transcript_82104/g.145038 Transcript_82104/m.145038 type:complete len:292 (+) Transcript_82104:783-1658(+)
MSSTLSWSPSPILAHMTIPSDGLPASFFFSMLAITTTSRPCISSQGMCFWRPLRICRGSASPKSICSTYNLSDPSSGSHFRILPTLKWHCEMAEASTAGGAAFWAALAWASRSFLLMRFPPLAAPSAAGLVSLAKVSLRARVRLNTRSVSVLSLSQVKYPLRSNWYAEPALDSPMQGSAMAVTILRESGVRSSNPSGEGLLNRFSYKRHSMGSPCFLLTQWMVPLTLRPSAGLPPLLSGSQVASSPVTAPVASLRTFVHLTRQACRRRTSLSGLRRKNLGSASSRKSSRSI